MDPILFSDAALIQFGICQKNENDYHHFFVPTDSHLKEIFVEMFNTTIQEWKEKDDAALEYNPAQSYPSKARLFLPFDHDYCSRLRSLYEAENIPVEARKIREIEKLFAYFCIFKMTDGTKFVAVKKASQFKGLAKQRLMVFADDSLKFGRDRFFKLDYQFDFIIAGDQNLILYPKNFESYAGLDEIILGSAHENIAKIGTSLPFVDTTRLADYSATRKRAARAAASIAMWPNLSQISEEMFCTHCTQCNVRIDRIDGQIAPSEGHEMDFLYALDRRRYNVSFIDGVNEIYMATARHPVE